MRKPVPVIPRSAGVWLRPADSAAFTLVETMVAVGILTMVAALIYSTVAVTLRAQKTAEQTQAIYHAGMVAMSKISRDLTNAFLSKHVSVLEKNRETLFLGREDEITFTYVGHYRWFPETPESDQGVVTYEVKSKRLLRREKTFIDDRPEKGGEEDVLAEGVKKLEFEYWDPIAEDWTDEWKAELEDTDPIFLDKEAEKTANLVKKVSGIPTDEDTFKLPPRVRVRLTLRDEDGNDYPFQTDVQMQMRDAFNW